MYSDTSEKLCNYVELRSCRAIVNAASSALCNPRAVYACLNSGEAVCPKAVLRQSICIRADIGGNMAKGAGAQQ